VTAADSISGPVGNGELLRAKIRLGARFLTPTIDAFWEQPRLVEVFPEFLVAIYGSVRATVPLMEAASSVALRLDETDPVAAALPGYFRQHMQEECDHDEWLLRDLEVIGRAREDVTNGLPNPTISEMVGAQYYWIFHSHPVALLGFFAVLEGNPPRQEDLTTIQARTGLPSEAFRMLRHHAELDERHASELFEFIDRLPLTARHVELIGMSALHTLLALQRFFDGLLMENAGISPPRGRASCDE
jgi:pyrroloquinoline quinone (PQQ) biosynthesis protein C